jgi:CheY-like chemotaxis protein
MSLVLPSRKRRILLVQPSGPLRFAARSALRAAGYQVDEAPDGPAALVRLVQRRGRYAAVVVDLRSPLAARGVVAAARGDGHAVPVVIALDASDAACAGAVELRRPFTPDELVRAVTRATS